jgi:hypothetical protein
MKKTYLTIDLDFFNASELNLFEILDNIKSKSKIQKAFLVSAHHQVLNHLNKMNDINHVINMDYHSDICGFKERVSRDKFLDCGTWGYFVNKNISKKSTFSWVFPTRKCESYWTGYCWTDRFQNPFSNIKNHNWASTHKSKFKSIPYDEIKYLSICISPHWTNSGVIEKYKPLLKKWDINDNEIKKLISLKYNKEEDLKTKKTITL